MKVIELRERERERVAWLEKIKVINKENYKPPLNFLFFFKL